MKNINKYLILFIVLFFQISCGGGSTQDGTGRPPNNERQVTSVGAITDDATLTVNGVEYDTSQAEVTIDNEEGAIDQLSLGHIVVVNGTLDESGQTGTADNITFNTTIFAPIESISKTNEENKSFIVLGQTVNTTADTLYVGEDFNHFDDIRGEGNLRIVGFVSENGSLVATYIEKVSLNPNDIPGQSGIPFYELNGEIKNLNTANATFEINNAQISYSDAAVVDTLSNGIEVEVLMSQLNSEDNLSAEFVNVINIDFGDESDLVELEGLVQFFAPLLGYLEISNTRINLDRNTQYIGGEVGRLDLDQKIEVEGFINANGDIVATRIIFLTSALTSHISSDILSSDIVTFRWEDVEADEYRLQVSSDGYSFYDEYHTGSTFEAVVNGLPVNGIGLIVDLHTKNRNIWSSQRYFLRSVNQLGELPKAELVGYNDGEVLISDSMLLEWSDVGADEYRVRIASGERTFYDELYSDSIPIQINSLPTNGASLDITIFTRYENSWFNNQYILISHSDLDNSELISHTDGDTLDSNSVVFSWSDVGADEYKLFVETPERGIFHEQYYDSAVQSVTLENLPSHGELLTLKLSTRHGNGWVTREYLLFCRDLQAARLYSHRTGDQLDSSTDTFSWNDVNANEYRLLLYNSGSIFYDQHFGRQTLSIEVSNLPENGSFFDAYLYTRHGSNWSFPEFVVLQSQERLINSRLLNINSGDRLNSDEIVFNWEDVNAEEYRFVLWEEESNDFIFTQYSNGQSTSLSIKGIPTNGEKLKARLYTRHGKGWAYHVYDFTAPNFNLSLRKN
ncbi:MAG: DUF5666 domain-containing protein [Cellvibrionaceae bacterium]